MVLPVFYTNLLLVKSPLLLFSALLMEKHLAIISPYFPSKSPTICCLDPPCLAKKQYRVGEKKKHVERVNSPVWLVKLTILVLIKFW